MGYPKNTQLNNQLRIIPMPTNRNGIIAKAAKALSQIEPNELKATLVSTLFVFKLMASYSKQELEAGFELGLD